MMLIKYSKNSYLCMKKIMEYSSNISEEYSIKIVKNIHSYIKFLEIFPYLRENN